jgi:hypothetical protein
MTAVELYLLIRDFALLSALLLPFTAIIVLPVGAVYLWRRLRG